MKEEKFFMYTNPLFWVAYLVMVIAKIFFKKGYIKRLLNKTKCKEKT